MKFCSKCIIETIIDETILEVIKSEYCKDSTPWYIGYSGGKDSSAVLSLVIMALNEIEVYHKPINVVYCDTGVELPIIKEYVYSTINNLISECENLNIPIKFHIAKPLINDRFFVKVIGRGYPTPTNIFRWCTDRLRINPVKDIINKNEKAIVLLGVRKGESKERDKVINRHSNADEYYLNQASNPKVRIFSPIINYSTKDVWNTLKFSSLPKSIDFETIGTLYHDAGSDCPVYRETKGTPCGQGRFGCWTCTVVRKDKSSTNLVHNGYDSIKPLLEFRNWLALFRDDTRFRCKIRRNKSVGLGPFTLEGRKLILNKLLDLQSATTFQLIEPEEIERIYTLWNEDFENPNYLEK